MKKAGIAIAMPAFLFARYNLMSRVRRRRSMAIASSKQSKRISAAPPPPDFLGMPGSGGSLPDDFGAIQDVARPPLMPWHCQL